jgi:hypothetical protein
MSTMLGLAAIRAGGFRTLWRQALMSAWHFSDLLGLRLNVG